MSASQERHMSDWDHTRPWYHGSDQQLTTLRIGSSITQNRDLARVFSHKPELVGQSAGGRIQHNGEQPGYLYQLAEAIKQGDIYPHPHPVNDSRWEWLTTRELSVQLLEITQVRSDELFSADDIAWIRQQQKQRGEQSFVGERDQD
jgi:hypothetical protein